MSAAGETIDWRAIRLRLMHGSMKLRPWEIRQMTLAEIADALDEPQEGQRRQPAGAVAMDPYEILEYAKRRRAMTPRQKLEQSRGW